MTAPRIEIRARHEGAWTVVSVPGEVDMATAPLLAEAMEKALAADGARLAIDFLETEFIDSSGLAALLAVKDAGRDIVLVCHEDGPIHRLMVLTGTDTQFTIVDSIVRAVGGGV